MVIDYWIQFLQWIEFNQLGDVASVIGVIISLIGFAATLLGVFKAKTASQVAAQAAQVTRDSIRLLDTVVDFSAAISILEEIKRHHRQEQWQVLPDRYAAIRKLLISLRASTPNLTTQQKTAIQSALTNLQAIEIAVDRGLTNPTSLKAAKFNKALSGDIDNLVAVLVELKATKAEGDRDLG